MGFKVGDRVVLIYTGDDLFVKYGDAGVITGINRGNDVKFPYRTSWDKESGKNLSCAEDELCLEAEFCSAYEDLPNMESLDMKGLF